VQQKQITMSDFNKNFFQANRNYTREMAEIKMNEKGFSNYSFDGCSYENGASFYFTLEDGKKVRVSDHSLTGKRAFEYIQIAFVEPKVMVSPMEIRAKYLAGEISKKEYKTICNEKGFIYKP